jgi:SPP1 gp7 family putative phage head morphogenesis protein
MMSNKTYWNNRDKERFEYIRQNLADDKAFNASLEKYYQRTIDAINKDIQSELQSFAARDGVSLVEARKKVSKADIRQFEAEAKKVVKEADQMRKKGKRVGYSDFSDEVNERMRLYNVTMRINRLEYLKSLIGVRLIELGVDINAELNVKLDEDTRNEFERQSGILAGAGMADAMDWWTEENVQKIVMSSTRSANFSTRIWSNVDVLKSELEKQLSRVLISGENPKATAKEFYKHMVKGVSNTRAAAERIARTESARCQTQATLESFKEYDVKYCRWIAEPRACVVCKEIASHSSGHGRGVYPVKDVPTLPQHPNCRCALSAHWVDEKSNAEVARLKRKKNTEKRVTINKEKQRKLTAEFRKSGGKVWQDAEAEAYLKKKGANAIALSEDLIALKNKPTISEVLEELYHVKQFRDGKIDLTNVSRYKAEIEAQNYLLSVKKLYNIPKEEILETKANLQYWKERLKNEKNRNY